MNKQDKIVMQFLHYLITEKGYNPIILQGAQNEIWLENIDSEYRVVRLVTNFVFNNEQLEFDKFKSIKISKKIKSKMFSLKMNVLSIYLNLGENVTELETEKKSKNFTSVRINSVNEVKKIDSLKKLFDKFVPEEEVEDNEEGMEMFIRLTKEINEKNEVDSKRAGDIFTMKKPIVTRILIGINIIVFILMYVIGNGSNNIDTLIKFGALQRDLVLSGDYYRLITAGFLHIGLIHLLLNMYALYIIGPQIESFYGRFKFIVIYLFSLLTGSLLSISFLSGIGAGASGAIFGLLGSLLYFGYHYRIYLGNVIKSQIIPIIILNLLIGFSISGIDNAAHIGGLIGGVFASYAVGVKYKSDKIDIINGIVISIIFLGFLIYFAFFL